MGALNQHHYHIFSAIKMSTTVGKRRDKVPETIYLSTLPVSQLLLSLSQDRAAAVFKILRVLNSRNEFNSAKRDKIAMDYTTKKIPRH